MQQRGFTLIELLVTFVVVAVMLVMAAPSFISFQKNSQMRSSANALLGAISAARAEAMKRQLNAFIRPGTCDTPSNDWTTGWVIYVDVDWDHACKSAIDIVVSTQPVLPSIIAVGMSTDPYPVAVDDISPYILVTGAGFVSDVTGALKSSQSFTFSLNDGSGDSRMLIIDGSGRSRVCVPPPGTASTPADPGCQAGQL